MQLSHHLIHQKLSDQLTHAMHRLSSLETSLSSISKQERMDVKSIEMRLAAIRHLRNLVHRHHFLLTSKTIEISNVPAGQIVPNLSECTPIELQIYREFADEHRKMIGAIAAQTQTLAKWARLNGLSWLSQLRATLCLSKISKFISKIRLWQQNLDSEHNQLDIMIKRTVTEIAGQQKAEQTDGSVSGLMKIFSDLDASTDEISRLHLQIQSEEATIQRMRAWLQQEEKFLKPPPQPAPAQSDIEAAVASLERNFPDPITQSRQRLTLARRFVDEFAPQPTRTQAPIGKNPTPKRQRPQGAVAATSRVIK